LFLGLADCGKRKFSTGAGPQITEVIGNSW
jgi:hypothetical protein